LRAWGRCIGFGVILFLCAAQGAWAETETQRLYDQGAFLDAASRGEEIGSIASLVLAARSLIAYGAYLAKPDEQVTVFGSALDIAARVLVQDPDNLEAHLQTVNGLGHISRVQGHVASHFKGYAKTAKKHLKRAKKIAPENPWVHALYGAWHAEIAVHAPKLVAFAYYGASKKKAVRYFERAITLGSDNPVILAEYGNAILMIDWRRNRGKARELYEKSLEIEPRNAFERLVGARTRRSLENL
jgi:tetratricopeptide (TPR) repeat protein